MDNNPTRVTIPFVQVGAVETPNARGADNYGKLENYFKAMFVTFASLRRFNANLELEVVSNCPLPPLYAALHEGIQVSTRIIPFLHEPPTSKSHGFASSLYYLDVLAELKNGTTILLDPDVLCVGDLSSLENFPVEKLGAVRMEYPMERPVNGLSLADAELLHAELGLSRGPVTYYGGELYVIPKELSSGVSGYAERAWQMMLKGSDRENKFQTEEHIMNYVLANFSIIELNDLLKRIWTTRTFRNVSGAERYLKLWHLPAEKGRGFNEMYKFAITPDSWFWHADDAFFVRRAETIMGIRHRRLKRWVWDQAGRFYAVVFRRRR